jgi:hypothetical protein
MLGAVRRAWAFVKSPVTTEAFMGNDRPRPNRPRVSSDPNRPAYDNPVGDKGDLVAGNNVAKRPRRAPDAKPQGHDSDRTLGQKPPK